MKCTVILFFTFLSTSACFLIYTYRSAQLYITALHLIVNAWYHCCDVSVNIQRMQFLCYTVVWCLFISQTVFYWSLFHAVQIFVAELNGTVMTDKYCVPCVSISTLFAVSTVSKTCKAYTYMLMTITNT